MKIRNRIFAGLLSFAVVAGELLPVYAAGNGEEAVYGEAETVEVSVSLIREGAYALYQPVLFKSSKDKIAFVDENGLIEARAEGSAVISAKVNGKKITIKVNVVPGDPE